MFFQEVLRSLLQQELNKNTQDVLFDVSLYYKKHDSYYTKLIQQTNELRKKVTPFSLVHIERIDVARVNLPEHNILDLQVQAAINLPTEKNLPFASQEFNTVYGVLDKFMTEYNAQTLPFGDVEYDMLNGGFTIDYELDINRNIGFQLKFKDDEDYLLFESGKNLAQKTFIMNKVGNTLQIQYLNNLNNYTTLTFDITIDEPNEVLINNVGTSDSIIVNGVEQSITSIGVGGLLDEFYKFNGTITDFYVQQTTFTNLQDYRDGLLTLEGLFDNPILIIDNFVTLDNNIDNGIILTKVGTIRSIGSMGYATFSFDTISPLSGVFEMFGRDYQEYDFTFNVIISQDTFMGNQVEYYLDNVRIYPFNKNYSIASESAGEQMINADRSTSVNNATGLMHVFTLYYKRDKKIIELVEQLKDDVSSNKVYDLKVIFPTFEIEHKVKIVDFGISPLEGEPLNYTVKLDKADSVLFE